MVRGRWMMRFARWHTWLGWLVGVPLLFWTISGLWMVARPIEEVRGTALRAEPLPLPIGFAPVLPVLGSVPAETMTLINRVDRPIWIIRRAGDVVAAADGATGQPMPRVDGPLARSIASAALQRPAAITGARAFAAVDAPLDLRRPRSSWQVRYADGVHVYVDAVTGEVLAVRSRQWRAFDLMWGLHIMDLGGREDSSHPILISFAGMALLSCLLGFALLFRRRRAAGR